MPTVPNRQQLLNEEREKLPAEMRQAKALEQIADTMGRLLSEIIAIRTVAQAPGLPPGFQKR
jgi:hypothetical protein